MPFSIHIGLSLGGRVRVGNRMHNFVLILPSWKIHSMNWLLWILIPCWLYYELTAEEKPLVFWKNCTEPKTPAVSQACQFHHQFNCWQKHWGVDAFSGLPQKKMTSKDEALYSKSIPQIEKFLLTWLHMKTAVWNPAACSDLDVCKVTHVPGPVHVQVVPVWIWSQLYSDPLLSFPTQAW